MKCIKLTQGQYATVDDKDYDFLIKYKWLAKKLVYGGFAAIGTKSQKRRRMHRVIMNAPKRMHIDHANHQTLDNRKENLRICTNNQNQHNQKIRTNGTSSYKGVHWSKKGRKWITQIRFNAKKFYLGCFSNEIEAAKAYDAKARELFCEYALTNF